MVCTHVKIIHTHNFQLYMHVELKIYAFDINYYI